MKIFYEHRTKFEMVNWIMKRILLILLVLVCFTVAGFRIDDGEPKWKAPASGFIDIIVESNVNRLVFSYPLNEISMYDTGEAIYGNEDAETVNIIVPVKDFRCSNKIAFKDFLTLLKADQYPNLTIAIPQKVLMYYDNDESVTLHNITINIAGVLKKYDIICRAENRNSKDYILIGMIKIRLNDLKIEPPEKYFGLVKIKDEVIVKFGFSLKDYSLAINNN